MGMCFFCDTRDAIVPERMSESKSCSDETFTPQPQMLTSCPESYSCVTFKMWPIEYYDKSLTGKFDRLLSAVYPNL
jgi:hypothetical protein